MKVGIGYDIHRLVEGRALLLGGVEIPSDRGEEGFSDGDALSHAVIDALLGPAGLGDIGSNFPPGDQRFRDVSSRALVRKAREMCAQAGWAILNIDCVVVLEAPRLLPHAEAIRARLAEDLGVSVGCITVKAKTKEGLDATGARAAVEAYAVALIERTAE